MTVRALYEKISALNIEQAAIESVTETKENLSDENRKQLIAGFNRRGERLRPYRSAKYARVKNQMNPLPGLGNPDFKVTGQFQRGIKTEVNGTSIVTASTDGKAMKLEIRDGPDIYGVGGTFKQEYIKEFLRPAFHRRISELTGLKLG